MKHIRVPPITAKGEKSELLVVREIQVSENVWKKKEGTNEVSLVKLERFENQNTENKRMRSACKKKKKKHSC